MSLTRRGFFGVLAGIVAAPAVNFDQLCAALSRRHPVGTDVWQAVMMRPDGPGRTLSDEQVSAMRSSLSRWAERGRLRMVQGTERFQQFDYGNKRALVARFIQE